MPGTNINMRPWAPNTQTFWQHIAGDCNMTFYQDQYWNFNAGDGTQINNTLTGSGIQSNNNAGGVQSSYLVPSPSGQQANSDAINPTGRRVYEFWKPDKRSLEYVSSTSVYPPVRLQDFVRCSFIGNLRAILSPWYMVEHRRLISQPPSLYCYAITTSSFCEPQNVLVIMYTSRL